MGPLLLGCGLAAPTWEPSGTLPLELVLVPGGTFSMGAAPGEVGALADEQPQHEVTVGHDLLVQRTEVTAGLFRAVMGYDPTGGACDDCPVTQVTWHAAAAFTNELTASLGDVAPCYACDGTGDAVICAPLSGFTACRGYRLPTEAEWERACRADHTGSFPIGGGGLVVGSEESCDSELLLDDGTRLADYATFCGAALPYPPPVGGLGANGYGLLDLAGSVWEWTNDWFAAYPAEAQVDPEGPALGEDRVSRGGAFDEEPQFLRCANRFIKAAPSGSYMDHGFRVVRTAW